MKKTALITGISGQDGAYLAQLLIKKNYRVIGTDRRSARFSNWRLKRLGIENEIIFMDNENHKKTWNNFTKFVLWGTIVVVSVLILMAIFLI